MNRELNLFILDNGSTFIIPDDQDIVYWKQSYPFETFKASNIIDRKTILVLSKNRDRLLVKWPWVGIKPGTWGYALCEYLKNASNELLNSERHENTSW